MSMTALILIIFFVLYLATIIFVWSLHIRRWHDLGHSGWFSLLNLVPIVNLVVLIYLLCAKGEEGSNKYGEPNVGKPFWRSVFAPGSLRPTTQPGQPVQPTPVVSPSPVVPPPAPPPVSPNL